MNQEIENLNKQIIQYESDIAKAKQKIKEIQLSCNHKYILIETGEYEDLYECSYCLKLKVR